MLLSTVFVSASNSDNELRSGPVHNIDTDEYFNEIQTAIDDSDTQDGHTIEVSAGTYYENILIEKTISLKGENKYTTIIDGGNLEDVIECMKTDGITISNFTIRNSWDCGGSGAGIKLDQSHFCNIYNNIMKENNNGICIFYSNNNIIADNDIINNTLSTGNGIRIGMPGGAPSNRNSIFNNNILNNTYGFWMLQGSNNTFSNNNINNTRRNFWFNSDVGGQIIDTTNMVNGQPMHYYYGLQDSDITKYNITQMTLDTCSNVTIEYSNFRDGDGLWIQNSRKIHVLANDFVNSIYNGIGVFHSAKVNISYNNISLSTDDAILVRASSCNISFNRIRDNAGIAIHYFSGESSYNNITYNNIENNGDGIYIYRSHYNKISNNTIKPGRIDLHYSNYNMVFHNNFLGSPLRYDDDGFNNQWDNGYPSGGNYWSDWTSPDNYSEPNQDQPGSDGIVDIPRPLAGSGGTQDNFPFTVPIMLEIEEVSIEDWPMLGRNPKRTAFNPYTLGPNVPNLLWKFNISDYSTPGDPNWFQASPIVAYGRVYIGSHGNNTLFCFDEETGEVEWNFTTSLYIGSTVAVKDGCVILNFRGEIYCLNAFNGNIIWNITLTNSVSSSPIIDSEKIYVSTGTHLWCLWFVNGTVVWSFPMDGRYQTPCILEDYIFISERDDKIYCLNKTTGIKVWERAFWNCNRSPIAYNGRVYFGSLTSFYCLNISTGDTIWQIATETKTAYAAAVAYDRIYLPCRDALNPMQIGITYCLNASTGAEIWNASIGSEAAPGIADGKVYIGDSAYYISCLDAETGDFIWKYRKDNPPYSIASTVASSPAICYNKMFVGSTDGNLYCFTVLPNITATATGPQGAGHDPTITITYVWTGSPSEVDLFWSNDTGSSWNYLGTDTSVDGVFEWGPASNPGPKPSKYWWIANAVNGSDDVGIPTNGTPPEAGPYNWKTRDLKINGGQPVLNPSGCWELVSVPLEVSGDPLYVFDDDNWGDGGTKWDYIQWYDPFDPAHPWKSYSIYRPSSMNDMIDVVNTRGFWIHITNNDGDCALTVGEGPMPTNATYIQLFTGWNLVGYPTDTQMAAEDAFYGTGADWVMVCDHAEPYRIKEVAPTYMMKPGEGYWVHVPFDTFWVVDW